MGVNNRKPVSADMRQMSDVEAAWLAGLFDGEGSIVLVNRRRAQQRPQYVIHVYNTYRPLVERIVEVTGLNNTSVRESKNPRHATAYKWSCAGADAVSILRRMRPWLLVKAERADAVFEGRTFERQSRWDDIYPETAPPET